MRISHNDIEVCRRNPRAWIGQKVNPSGSIIRTGYAGATKLAVYHFHKTNDPSKTQRYLEDLFDSLGLRNAVQKDRALDNLDDYMAWYSTTMPVVAAYRLRLNYDLDSGWILGGEISRIDIDIMSGGYRGIILGNVSDDWEHQLRIPLIQRALANRLQRPEEDMAIGFQNLDGSDLRTVSFPKKELDDAETAARDLARTLAEEWRKQSGRRIS
jgi:hypothetical protein